MVTASETLEDFQQVLNENSHPIRIKYYTVSGASTGYDDDVVLTQSGTDVWASGISQPLKEKDVNKSAIAVLQQQGEDLSTVQRLYMRGDVSLSGESIKIGIGSPVTFENTIVTDGVEQWNIDGTPVYNLAFVKRLTTGSFIGE